tara:strand:- start:384 stop:2048 length:1665 start_codon:yes stop_codon:yes gene_type:complete
MTDEEEWYENREQVARSLEELEHERDEGLMNMVEEEEEVGGKHTPKEVIMPNHVKAFVEEAVMYSRDNELPAKISYYSILGSLMQDMVEIPFEETTIDTRVHFCWIQTARSGKTTLIKSVLAPVIENIYKELLGELGIDEKEGKPNYNLLQLAEYTAAALVGDYSENKKYKPDAQKKHDDAITALNLAVDEADREDENYNNVKKKYDAELKLSKNRWHTHVGPLHGSGFWFADEFEGSGVFKERSHKEGMNIVFQTLMNNFHNGANKYDKILTGKPTITMDSRFTLFACTYPPEKLKKTITEKGLLQRFLPYIYDVPDDKITSMRKSVIKGFGKISKRKDPAIHLSEGFIEIYHLVRERWKDEKESNALHVISYSSKAIDALESEHRKLLDYIQFLPTHIRKIVRLFEMNLLEYIGKIAVLSCISMAKDVPEEKRWIVTATHVNMGAKIVKACYTTLVEWLEDSIKGERKSALESNNLGNFQQAYEDVLKSNKSGDVLEGNYVRLATIFKEVQKTLKKSANPVRKMFFPHLEKQFDITHKGNAPYIKPNNIKEE